MADPRRPAGTTTDQRARRRFARRQWARRWASWRLVLATLVLLLVAGGAVWVVWFSTVMAVEGVDVRGTQLLSQGEVRRSSGVPEGEPLARVDLEAARARVEAMVEVRSADVSRAWPDTVRIDVVERVSVALVDFNGRLRGMDSEGVVFQDFEQAPGRLPQVRSDGTPDSEARQEVARVVTALPDDLAGRVEYVEVETIDQIALVLGDGRRVVWGSAEQSDVKARVVSGLLAQPGRVYDVSVPERPVTGSSS